jgi:hypothetical protein
MIRDMLIRHYSSDAVFESDSKSLGKNRIIEYLELWRGAFTGVNRINTCAQKDSSSYFRCVTHFSIDLIYGCN